jgi:hypothetical protein
MGELHIGLRENRFHSIAQAGQSIAADNQHVLHAARFEIVEDF